MPNIAVRLLAIVLIFDLAAGAACAAAEQTVPVRYGGDPALDACATLAAVTGLDPRGDNFLSVRSGPGGTPFREVDRLHTGQQAWICTEQGVWRGIVYARAGSAADCGVTAPRARASDYRGPCRSGWVHKRYLRVLAG